MNTENVSNVQNAGSSSPPIEDERVYEHYQDAWEAGYDEGYTIGYEDGKRSVIDITPSNMLSDE